MYQRFNYFHYKSDRLICALHVPFYSKKMRRKLTAISAQFPVFLISGYSASAPFDEKIFRSYPIKHTRTSLHFSKNNQLVSWLYFNIRAIINESWVNRILYRCWLLDRIYRLMMDKQSINMRLYMMQPTFGERKLMNLPIHVSQWA